MVAVDAARWPLMFGWLYRNTPGNLVASGIAFVAGVTVGGRALKQLHTKLDAHHAEHLTHLDRIHRATEPATTKEQP